MTTARVLVARVVSFFWRGRLDRDLDDQIRAHLDLAVDDYTKRGMALEDARLAARRDFGGVIKVKQAYRETRGWTLLDAVIQDAHYAWRSLRKSRAFTLVAVITLTLGIGANTAIFSIVYGVLLRPLPYRDASSLVLIDTERWFGGERQVGSFSAFELRDWAERSHSFEAVAGFAAIEVALERDQAMEPLDAVCVSSHFFSTLGEPMAIGRPIGDGDDRSSVVVVSHRLWFRAFNGDPAAVGRSVVLNGEPYTIIGVTPVDFRFPNDRIDIWTPLEQAQSAGIAPWLNSRKGGGVNLVARLKPGVALAQARADAVDVGRQLAEAYPDISHNVTPLVTPMIERVAGAVRPALLLLLAAVGLVLLVACLNVTNLLLAREAGRAREMTLRLALGASHGRLVLQSLTESAIIALAGGASGVLLATAAVRVLVWLEPAQLPRLDAIRVDGPVLLFAAAAASAAALLAGVGPVVLSSREGAGAAFLMNARGVGGLGARRVRSTVVVAELAVSIVLLVGSGLFGRSLVRLLHTDVGARTDHAVTVLLDFSLGRFDEPAQRALAEALVARVRAIPGVQRAALGAALPPSLERFRYTLKDVATAHGVMKEYQVNAVPVTPDFFRGLGVPLLQGRLFTDADGSERPGVMIMSADTASLLFGDNPIGGTLSLPTLAGVDATFTLAGVVGNVKYRGLAQPAAGSIYLPFAQQPSPSAFLIARTSGDPLSVVPDIRRAIGQVDRRIGLLSVKTLDELMSEQVAQPRFRTAVLAAMAGLALALAAIGLYGAVTYSVSRRTPEIGIRVALGADEANIVWMVLREALVLSLAGGAIGLAGAFALARLLAGLLYGVSPTDPPSFAVAVGFLLLFSIVASYPPARRATRVDPMVALRAE